MTEVKLCTEGRADHKQDRVTPTVIAQKCWDF